MNRRNKRLSARSQACLIRRLFLAERRASKKKRTPGLAKLRKKLALYKLQQKVERGRKKERGRKRGPVRR